MKGWGEKEVWGVVKTFWQMPKWSWGGDWKDDWIEEYDVRGVREFQETIREGGDTEIRKGEKSI